MGVGRQKEGTARPKGPGQEGRGAGSWTQALLAGGQAQGTGRGQWLGSGPRSGKKLPAVLLQPLPPGVCSHQSALVHPEGLDSSSAWFVEHQAPLLPNTLSLVPVRRRKLPTESAHSLQGPVSEQFEFNS